MKIKKFSEREILKFAWSAEKEKFTLESRFKQTIYRHELNVDQVTEDQMKSIKRFQDGTHRLYMILNDEQQFVTFKTTKRIAKQGIAIDKYVDRPHEELEYLNYYQYRTFTQLDGITTIVGMSGAGKTYSALSMLHIFSKVFTKIAYLNYELTNRDIVRRYKEMFPDPRGHKMVLDKLYMKEGIMTSLDLEDILDAMDVMPYDKVVFIVDNVGSVIGQDDNVYHRQNEFLKHLDIICKERGFHALALTQTVKDHNADFFDDTGEIKGGVNMSIMSGSIMLGNLSRSVLFTGFNGKTEQFKVKVLKKGTGLMYSDQGVDRNADYIKN